MREVLDDLTSRFPALRAQIFEDGDDRAVRQRLRRGRGRAHARRARDAVADGSTVMLLPAMAGGALSTRSRTSPARPRRQHAARRAAAALAEGGRPALREARGAEPDRLDQGPRREGDDRGRRGLRRARARAASCSSRRAATPASRSRWSRSSRATRSPCVMPENATEERGGCCGSTARRSSTRRARRARTAPCALALELAERDPRYFMPFQYANAANPRAHYEGTGAEIAEALDRVDVLVAGLGTGGTLMGAGARLREAFPDIVVAAAEPLPGDPVMGLRSLEDGYMPPILDVSKLDRKMLVSNDESVARPARAARQRGDLRRRLVRRGRPRRAQARRRARRGRRRLRARRRRLEVPLGRVLGRRRRRARDGARLWWWSPTAVRVELARARARRGAERVRAGCVVLRDGRAERYVRGRNAAASPYRFELRSTPRRGSSRTRATSSRSSTRTCRLAAAPVAHRRREHRPLGRQALPDPVAAQRRAGRWRIVDGKIERGAAHELSGSARQVAT